LHCPIHNGEDDWVFWVRVSPNSPETNTNQNIKQWNIQQEGWQEDLNNLSESTQCPLKGRDVLETLIWHS